jgi:hypothetical protein
MIHSKEYPTVVCFPFVGDVVGGSHISALNLIRRIDRRRFEPLVLLHAPDGPVAELFRREGIVFEPAPSAAHLNGSGARRNLQALLGGSWTMARFLRRRGCASSTPMPAAAMRPGRCRRG